MSAYQMSGDGGSRRSGHGSPAPIAQGTRCITISRDNQQSPGIVAAAGRRMQACGSCRCASSGRWLPGSPSWVSVASSMSRARRRLRSTWLVAGAFQTLRKSRDNSMIRSYCSLALAVSWASRSCLRSRMASSSSSKRAFHSASSVAATRRCEGSTSRYPWRTRSASERSASMRSARCRSATAKSAYIFSRTVSARFPYWPQITRD